MYQINKLPFFIRRRIPKLRYAWNILQFFTGKSGLSQMGWFVSAWHESAIDRDKEPIPWITYPCLYFLNSKVGKNMEVFEFGSGNSTLWWASKAKSVSSVEHEKFWSEKMQKNLPQNATITYKELSGGYTTATKDKNKKYDIIFIDGRLRAECAKNSNTSLKNGGVIIWDNSERPRYQEQISNLIKNGFRRLDFYGMTPIDNKVSVTTIFYKDRNVLEI